MDSPTGPSKLQPSRANFRLLVLCAFFGLASFVWGYNIGVVGTLYVHPGFKKALKNPPASTTGLITSIYYLGTWTSYLFISHRISDRLGRRAAVGLGVFTICIGAAIQCAAGGPNPLAAMIIGRIICGLGVAVVSTSVPMYQSECAPAHQRGRYVVMNHIGLVTGLATAFWVGFGMSYWKTAQGEYLGWRFNIAVQFIPAILLFAGLPFCPETPRWLVKKGRIEQARKTLEYLRDPNVTDIPGELASIEASIDSYRATKESWTALFTRPALFARLWRASLLLFMAQMSGSTSIKYYLPQIFIDLGISTQMSLMIGGIESTLKIGCTILEMMIVDRVGRKTTLTAGCVIMAIALLINGALPQVYPNNANRAADYACIVFIFFYTFGYSIGFGPASWVYGAEIFPTNFRARGLNFAASSSAIGSIIASQTWPVGMERIGSRTHFIFMSTNIASGIIIWLFYPETKQRSIEDMDALFGNLEHGPKRSMEETERDGRHDHGPTDESHEPTQPKQTV